MAKIFELSITTEACKSIQKATKLNICSYQFIIEEEYVRHIKNYHEKDLHLLNQLPNILNHFTHVEKSLTRNTRTGSTDVSLVFRKKIDDDTVQMVALRILKNKRISLRTLFRP